MATETTVKLTADVQPLTSFIEIVNGLIKSVKGRVNILPETPDQLARVQVDKSVTNAGELIVTLYPSDAFLRYVAAIWARNVELTVIK